MNMRGRRRGGGGGGCVDSEVGVSHFAGLRVSGAQVGTTPSAIVSLSRPTPRPVHHSTKAMSWAACHWARNPLDIGRSPSINTIMVGARREGEGEGEGQLAPVRATKSPLTRVKNKIKKYRCAVKSRRIVYRVGSRMRQYPIGGRGPLRKLIGDDEAMLVNDEHQDCRAS